MEQERDLLQHHLYVYGLYVYQLYVYYVATQNEQLG